MVKCAKRGGGGYSIAPWGIRRRLAHDFANPDTDVQLLLVVYIRNV